MNSTLKTSGRFSACSLVVMLLLAAATAADDDRNRRPSPEELANAVAEAGKPGAAHAKLQPLAGTWNYTCKVWLDPSNPPVEMTGTIERRWILGGRFLEERVAGTGFDGKPGFEAVGLLGYDNALEKYTATWACNVGTGISSASGVSNGWGTFTFQTECSCPVSKEVVLGREIIRIESEDRIVSESYRTVNGEEVKAMELIAVRRK